MIHGSRLIFASRDFSPGVVLVVYLLITGQQTFVVHRHVPGTRRGVEYLDGLGLTLPELTRHGCDEIWKKEFLRYRWCKRVILL